MKKLSIIILNFLILSGLQAQEVDTTALYDFWVGKWNLSWDEGDGNIGRGTNNIVRILNDQVIQENFEIISGQNKGFLGTSLTVYTPGRKTWKQAWADSQGGYYDFTGEWTENNRIFKTTPRESNGNVIIQRMVFYDIKANSLMWDWEGSRDGGKSWNLLWRVKYERAK